jgi:hypothetical protein
MTETISKTREAWSEFADEFTDIAKEFRRNYEALSEDVEAGTTKSRNSIERATKTVRRALDDLAGTIGQSLSDPAIRGETEEAGEALLKAVGATLSELGAKLQQAAVTQSPPNRER